MRRFLVGLVLIVTGTGSAWALWYLLHSLSTTREFVAFGTGFLLYFFLWLVTFHRRESFWAILEHEIIHAVMAFLFRKQVRSLNAKRSRGGSVHLDSGNRMIALAPYFLPLPALIIAFIMPLFQKSYLPYLAGLEGFLYGFHFFPLLQEFHFSQPDIRNSGIIFSTIAIVAGNIFFLGIIAASLAGEWAQFAYFVKQSAFFSIEIVKNIAHLFHQRFIVDNLNALSSG